MNVYFDTNVYTHINNRQYGLETAHIAKLVASIKRKKIKVYLGSTVLDETTSGLLSNPTDALSRLRLI
ncbi:MAG: hypothetical protein DMF75_01325 [Acidobacteria bacterium]|nr:MAG: hypothetical protein DMF75_01325 [Acidobacteriota bacterium]